MSEWISYCSRMVLKLLEDFLGKIREGTSTFLGKVVVFVSLAHFLLIVSVWLFSSTMFQKAPMKGSKVFVSHVILQPSKSTFSGEKAVSSQKKTSPVKKAAVASNLKQDAKSNKKTSPAKEEKKAGASKKTASSKDVQKQAVSKEVPIRTVKKESAKKKAKEKIAEAKQALGSSLSSSSPDSSVKELAKTLVLSTSSLNAEAAARGGGFLSIEDIVADKMRTFLTLPEHGSVEIELTLSEKGKIEKIVIAQADSEKNRRYVENSLRGMQFFEVASLLKGQRQTLLLLLTSKS